MVTEIKHDDVIKWKHFPRYWPFVRGIHRSPVNSPHKGQWSGALMFSLICPWINVWVNNREAGHLRRHHAHFHVIVMVCAILQICLSRYALNTTAVINSLEQNDSEDLLLIRPTGICFSEIRIKTQKLLSIIFPLKCISAGLTLSNDKISP